MYGVSSIIRLGMTAMEVASPSFKATLCTFGGSHTNDDSGILRVLIRHETPIGFTPANRALHPCVRHSNELGPILRNIRVFLSYTHTFISQSSFGAGPGKLLAVQGTLKQARYIAIAIPFRKNPALLFGVVADTQTPHGIGRDAKVGGQALGHAGKYIGLKGQGQILEIGRFIPLHGSNSMHVFTNSAASGGTIALP